MIRGNHKVLTRSVGIDSSVEKRKRVSPNTPECNMELSQRERIIAGSTDYSNLRSIHLGHHPKKKKKKKTITCFFFLLVISDDIYNFLLFGWTARASVWLAFAKGIPPSPFLPIIEFLSVSLRKLIWPSFFFFFICKAGVYILVRAYANPRAIEPWSVRLPLGEGTAKQVWKDLQDSWSFRSQTTSTTEAAHRLSFQPTIEFEIRYIHSLGNALGATTTTKSKDKFPFHSISFQTYQKDNLCWH